MTLGLSRGRRVGVLLVWLALVLAAVAQIVRTPFTADLSAFLPASPDAQQRVLIDQLKSGLPARTLFIGIDGGAADGASEGAAAARGRASRELAAALRASGLFEQVSNGENEAWAGVGAWVFEHRYALSPAVDSQRFSAEGLRDAIADTVSLLGTPAGNSIKPLLERDPTGETQRIAESLIPSRGPRTEDGVWVSRQGARAVLLAIVKAPGADLDAQALAIARVHSEFAPLAERGLRLQLSGAPLFAVQSRASIEHEVKWLAIVGTLVMSSLLLLAFASLKALAVALLPVATGVLSGITAVSLGFGNVHGITLGFGSTLIGEAVDYAIYYLIQARAGAGAGHGRGAASDPAAGAGAGTEAGTDEPGWRRWLVGGWPTVRLGLLTSVCGFAALAFSGFPGLAQLGVFSVAGLVGAALATRYVLPVLMPEGSRGMGLRRQMGRLARWGMQVLPRSRWLWLVLGLASAAAVWQRSDLWQAKLSSLSPVPAEALELDASLRADLSSADGGPLVVVQGPDAETLLQRAEVVAARLDALVEQRVLAGYSSITHLLPSRATQQRRLASLPGDEALRQALQDATRGGPLRFERLAPFLAEVARARSQVPLTPQSVRGTALNPLVSALLMQRDDGSWAALMPLQAAGEALDQAALDAALKGLPGTQSLDIGHEVGRLYERYLNEARAQALLGALGVVLLVAAWLRSPRRVLAVCQPLLLAVLITLGGLAVLQVPIGILHLVGLLLVVAVGSNYALFFDLLREQAIDDQDTLASLLLANLTTVLSFGLIAMSTIPALSDIGRVVAPGALLALLLAAAFTPRRPVTEFSSA